MIDMIKKFLLKRWLISAILIAFTILFIALKSVWSGFVFIALPFLTLFCIYWIVILIIDYINDYHKHFDDEFIRYRTEMINFKNVTPEEFEQNLQLHIKKFKKSLRFDKFIDICKILFVISVFILIVAVLFKL